ncbi:MAG: RNA-directed DNA polymerase [Gammaproteobacteria bacterium AqS3]|nr:RNA-directed DNA polymerase [Gammaproteobacteria bacterium AqS3]
MAEENSKELGYPDLPCGNEVYKALLDHGLMPEVLPPCFTSQGLSELEDIWSTKNPKPYGYIRYFASRHTSVPREQAIPHPIAYARLCKLIGENWNILNSKLFIEDKKNRVHVRKLKNKQHIFEMNYRGTRQFEEEDLELKFRLGANYYVKADIATFFPSIYTHAIDWAIEGKEKAKKNKDSDTLGSRVDCYLRYMNEGQTLGIPIGPHASNIISELLLVDIDKTLQNKKCRNYLRHIDDYAYYAKTEDEARKFIRELGLCLGHYELRLNAKKTDVKQILKTEIHWTNKLRLFKFSDAANRIGFTTAKAHLDLALSLAQKSNDEVDLAPLKYALKRISSYKKWTPHAAHNILVTLSDLTVRYPYFCPLYETVCKSLLECMNDKYKSKTNDLIRYFVNILVSTGYERIQTDMMAYGLYFSVRYKVVNDFIERADDQVIEAMLKWEDCVSLALLYEYAAWRDDSSANSEKIIESLVDKVNNFKDDKEMRDRYWLLMYQVLSCKEIKDHHLKELKRVGFQFVNWERESDAL